MRGADPPRAGRLSRTGAKSGARVGAPPRPRIRDPRLPFPVAPSLQRFQVLPQVVLLPGRESQILFRVVSLHDVCKSPGRSIVEIGRVLTQAATRRGVITPG